MTFFLLNLRLCSCKCMYLFWWWPFCSVVPTCAPVSFSGHWVRSFFPPPGWSFLVLLLTLMSPHLLGPLSSEDMRPEDDGMKRSLSSQTEAATLLLFFFSVALQKCHLCSLSSHHLCKRPSVSAGHKISPLISPPSVFFDYFCFYRLPMAVLNTHCDV